MIVKLTLNELVYLDDGLTLLREEGDFDPRFSGSRLLAPMAVSAAPPELLLKIGSAIVDLPSESNETIEIDLEEEDLWLIREVSQSSVNYNGEAVGLNLKRKIYSALRAIYTGEILEEIDLPPVDNTLADAIDKKKDKDYLAAYRYLEDSE